MIAVMNTIMISLRGISNNWVRIFIKMQGTRQTTWSRLTSGCHGLSTNDQPNRLNPAIPD